MYLLFIACQQNYFGIIRKTKIRSWLTFSVPQYKNLNTCKNRCQQKEKKKKLSKKVLEYQIFLDLFIYFIYFLPGQLPPAPTFSELAEFTKFHTLNKGCAKAISNGHLDVFGVCDSGEDQHGQGQH
jgi:hypothetical protein